MDSSPYHDLAVVIDSTSSLLDGLDLIGGDLPAKNMDDMETDLLMVIPDTPDRVAAVRREGNVGKGEDLAIPTSSESLSRRTRDRFRNNLMLRKEGRNDNPLDDESIFRRAKMAGELSKSIEYKASPPQTHRTKIEHKEDSVSLCGQSSSFVNNEFGKGGRVTDMTSRVPLDISHPTGCRNAGRNSGKDFHVEPHSNFVVDLNDVESSPTFQPIRRTRSGNAVAPKLPGGICEAEKTSSNVKGLDRSSCLQLKKEHPSRALKFDVPTRVAGHRKLVRNGCIAPCNIAKSVIPVGGGRSTLLSEVTCQDKGKGIELSSDTGHFDPSRDAGLKRALQNGCLSPSSIVIDEIVRNENKDCNGKMARSGNAHGMPSSELLIISPDVGGCQSSKNKGKAVLDDTVRTNEQDTKSRSSSSRVNLMPSKDSAVAGVIHKGIRLTGEAGWRTTCNRNWGSDSLKGKDEDGPFSNQVQENLARATELVHCSSQNNSVEAVPSFPHGSTSSTVNLSSDIISEPGVETIGSHGSQRLLKGKRKSRSGCSHRGESSSFDISGSSAFPSSEQPSATLSFRTRNSQRCGITAGPVIDLDELSSPELRQRDLESGSPVVFNEYGARAQQVESDEMLARHLQEQLFNESPGIRATDEIDASIAWTLQQEEDARRASYIGSRHYSHPRDTSVAHLYRHYPQPPFQNFSGRSASRARSSSRMAARSRTNVNRQQMDLEARLNYLEALEAAFDNSSDMRMSNALLHLQRDFNENDYEMLLALDNDNHQHVGASLQQINSLPLSVNQMENCEEACAICLENPSVGDAIRHLPCLHKFHKDCIDTWLRRKTSCPICKSDIS